MKKFIIFTFALSAVLIFLGGCSSRSQLESKIDMTVSVDPQKIVLTTANFLKQKAKINYSLTNRSDMNFAQNKYEMVLGLARENELSYTVLQFINQEIPAGKTVSGTYEYLFEKILGADGRYEIRFVFSEKDGSTSWPIKSVESPIEVQYK